MPDLVTSPPRELPWIEAPAVGFDPPAGAAAFPFGQAWRSPPEPAFQPATAWLAATPDAFHVWATLSDAHPRTNARETHARLWDLGDVFEIFLQRIGDEAYHEFHVAPNGRLLQLRFPRGDWPRTGDIAPYIRRDALIDAHVQLNPTAGTWHVRAAIPFRALTSDPARGSSWRVCFARYDYDDAGVPCCSASAPLTQLDFHRRHEWTTISLPPPDPC